MQQVEYNMNVPSAQMPSGNNPLEQELVAKTCELEAQRRERECLLVEITLKQIAEGVVSRQSEILQVMSGNGASPNAVREIVVREIKRAAGGRLWCPEYVEKLKSNQRMMIYTGSHWEALESQQWMDFVDVCAQKCGVPESQCMTPAFMKALYEAVAYNLAKFRKQRIPDGDVWLNVSNGTLVVHKDGTVVLREHSREDVFTYTLSYVYDPQAECPQWHRFIDRVLPEADEQLLLQEFIGYCLMPHHELERLLLLYGEGLNGKSVTLEVIEALLGSMNVSYLSLSDLTNDDVKRAGIEGKLLNISHESGKDVNPNVLKQLTSGERVTIKHLYRDPRETSDYGKFIAAFNILPRAENSFGFFRRLLILPYKVTIPKEEIDRQLASKLKQELSGILNWVLVALPALMSRGEFSPSENSEQALEHYRLQSDNVRLFLAEMCEPSEVAVKATDLFQAYRNYCFESQLKPVGRNTFFTRLESLGHAPVMYANIKHFNLRVTLQ